MKRLGLAIARDRSDLADLDGTARFTSGGVSILHGSAPFDVLSPGLETIQDYASTIARFHARETILPLRFGSIHDDLSSLGDWLRVHVDEWRGRLDEVEGCDEMGLRVLLDASQDPPRPGPITTEDRPGTAYLNVLRSRHAVADAIQAEASRIQGSINDQLAGTFRQFTIENPIPGRERLVSLTYLVPRPLLDRFRWLADDLQARFPGKLLLTGPWPPYSFASGNSVGQ